VRILCLAPHPFFQERGTPIDVFLVLRVLCKRPQTTVDAVVYSEGADISLPNVTIHRTPDVAVLRNVRPGFSVKKLLCDLLLLFCAWRLVRRDRYHLIHAGEEAVFIALLFKFLYGIPYAYDLDSSIAQQTVEGKRYLRPLSPLFRYLETFAIRRSAITFPVCNALAELCEQCGSRKTVTLHDISQLEDPDRGQTGWLKESLGLRTGSIVILYSGNLEAYQGIDLLLRSFRLAAARNERLHLVIIGGVDEDIRDYQGVARSLAIDARTHFLGRKSFRELERYLAEADILVSPRRSGINTPMKIFPYLHSGRVLVATDIRSHTQVLTKKEAVLAAPEPERLGEALVAIAADPELRATLGRNGRRLVEENHMFEHHRRRLNEAYDWLEEQVVGGSAQTGATSSVLERA
jgi:glycosyltransferase involved in cell wall biosynthesis